MSAATPIGGWHNVFLDAASAHPWAAMSERVFIERVVAALADELGPGFAALTVFVFSPAYPGVRPASADVDRPGKVLLYLSDESSHVPLALTGRYRAIFKAYLRHDLPGTAIFPLPLGYVGDPVRPEPRSMAERPVHMFFSGNLNVNRAALYQACHPRLSRLPGLPAPVWRAVLRSPLRHRLRRDLDEAAPPSVLRFTAAFKTGLDPQAYTATLARSRVVLCPRGFVSAETFRHVEAMRAGAVVVTTPMPDTALYRGAPLVVVPDWRAGLPQARALATDLNRLEALQSAGRAWYDTHWSERAAARGIAAALAGLPATPRVL